ncbi:exodeoxyribonuclease III [Candidatus Parcubacteria bacterium]|nr:MAG: exodeoxyribonuclease III [Candidatus Parcubacteria bacterium]
MKLISWNINGIRAVIKKGLLDYLKKEKAEVFCFQEIKIAEVARIKEGLEFSDWQEFWNSAERPGYSGTLTLVKKGIKVGYLHKLKWDDEGRIQALEFEKFILVNVYFPNANHELSRLEFKMKFNDKLLAYLKKLEKKKPVIICGDYNVAHEEIDLARPKENVGNPGFTDEERAWMNKFLDKGFTDTFRYKHPDSIKYSWWSYRAGARARNVGWRIDYFCVSSSIKNKIKKAYIQNDVLGSDHCPVGIEM